jgi:hypothetical protein
MSTQPPRNFFQSWQGRNSLGTPMEGSVSASAGSRTVHWSEETATWPAHTRFGGAWTQSFEALLQDGPQSGCCPEPVVAELQAFVEAHSRAG